MASEILSPAAEESGLELVRFAAGDIEGPAAERLGLFRLGMAELTTSSAHVLRMLGRWEGWRSAEAVLVHAHPAGEPNAAGEPGTVPCALDDKGRPADAGRVREAVAAELKSRLRDTGPVPPLCHLLDGIPPAEPERFKTDRFRERIEAPPPLGEALRQARTAGLDAVRAVEGRLPHSELVPAAAIDLLLSYRAVSGWNEMVELAAHMEPALARTPLVREQAAMALNRLGRADEAAGILLQLLAERGPSSETFGLLGRVYKDRWSDARQRGDTRAAHRWLRSAIDSYTRGFEADPRDVYPGMNAATLMELADPPDPRRHAILPVLDYILALRAQKGHTDYWDHASIVEVAVLRRDARRAGEALAAAVAALREPWEAKSTARNLRLIEATRAARGERDPWLAAIIDSLDAAAHAPAPSPRAAP